MFLRYPDPSPPDCLQDPYGCDGEQLPSYLDTLPDLMLATPAMSPVMTPPKNACTPSGAEGHDEISPANEAPPSDHHDDEVPPQEADVPPWVDKDDEVPPEEDVPPGVNKDDGELLD